MTIPQEINEEWNHQALPRENRDETSCMNENDELSLSNAHLIER